MNFIIIKAIPEEEIKQQKQDFQTLLDDLGQASDEEIRAFLNGREPRQPEAELTQDLLAKFQDLITANK
jgi:hypothetical protein